jgi:hypothetical protein
MVMDLPFVRPPVHGITGKAGCRAGKPGMGRVWPEP